MKDTSVNTSSEVTLFGNNFMARIKKMKNQHKRPGLDSIYRELQEIYSSINPRRIS